MPSSSSTAPTTTHPPSSLLSHARHPDPGAPVALRHYPGEVHVVLALLHLEVEDEAEAHAVIHQRPFALHALASLDDVDLLRRNLQLFLRRRGLGEVSEEFSDDASSGIRRVWGVTHRHRPAHVLHGGQRVLVHVLVVPGGIPGRNVEGSQVEIRGFIRRDERILADHADALQEPLLLRPHRLVHVVAVLTGYDDLDDLLEFLRGSDRDARRARRVSDGGGGGWKRFTRATSIDLEARLGRTSLNSSLTLLRSLSSSDSSKSSTSASSSLSLTSENFFIRRSLPGKYPKPSVSSCSLRASARRSAFRSLARPSSSRCFSSHSTAASCCSCVNTQFMGAASSVGGRHAAEGTGAGRSAPPRVGRFVLTHPASKTVPPPRLPKPSVKPVEVGTPHDAGEGPGTRRSQR